jgi:hypothetical protein
VDDPVVGAAVAVDAPAVVPQTYETPELVARARRLAPQTYADAGSFVPLSLAHDAGWTRAIRITAVWDVIDSGDETGVSAQRRMCTTEGETAEVKGTGGWRPWTTADFPGTTPCGAKTVVAPGNARYLAMKARTDAAVAFWQGALAVKRVQDRITLDASVASEFGLAPGTSYGDTDLVLIMTARPSPASPIAGFAVCYQRDQRGRCTVGQFNWVPEILNVEASSLPDTIESEMHTALHELVHVLGGMSPGSTVAATPFIDETGAQRSTGVFAVEDDPVYGVPGKKRTLIVTPRVANFTQTYLDCPTARGLPLEDVPLGKGSHWEARVMGPELMSYGSGSGQVYISDATLGFLEDTNQYIVDYSYAGPIVTTADVDDFSGLAGLSFLTTNEAPSGYVPPPPPPPGKMRWGAGAGCGFLDGKPTETWPAGYLCTRNQAYGCTPDHRMSAVCIVKGDYAAAEQTCGEYRQDGSGANCVPAPTSGVPTYMQWFATDAEAAAAAGTSSATAATTGGYNNAMDYVPVLVGYWNCMYSTPKDNSSEALGGGDTGSQLREFVSSFGKATDMATFGGQARCPSCRCLPSSLMELTKGYNPEAPEYGLCYRVNCYRPDYLQVAVKSSLSSDASFWYGCPPEGGKLYIAGFTGAITCPAAAEFCAHETITGVRYPEQNRVLEAIFWGGLCVFAAVMFLICGMPFVRDRVINCTKKCCGARVFEVAVPKTADGGPLPLPACPSRVLLAINLLTLLAGLGLTGACGYAIYVGSAAELMALLAMGILTTMLSGIGLRASCKKAEHGPSCYLLTYFFADVVLFILMLWTVIYSFAFTTWTDIAETRYDTLIQYLPDSYKVGTREENIAHIRVMLESNQYAIAGVFIGILATLLVTLAASGRMIHGRILMSIFITCVNNTMIAFGALMLIVGLYLIAFKASVVAGASAVVGLVIVTGAVFVIVGAVGHAGTFKRNAKLVYVAMGLQALLGCLAAAACAVCFSSVSLGGGGTLP